MSFRVWLFIAGLSALLAVLAAAHGAHALGTLTTLTGATSGRGLQGRGASSQGLQPGRSLVGVALRSRCAKAVQSGYGGRWELVLIIVWFALHTSRVIEAPAMSRLVT